MSPIANAIDRLDRVEVGTLLWINGAVAAFVVLAHGGALVVDRLGESPKIAGQLPLLYLSAALGLVGLLLSLLGLAVVASRTAVVKAQTLLLLALAAGMVGFAFHIIAFGPAPDTNFSWNPLLFAFVIAYPAYMIRRTFMPLNERRSAAWRFAPVWAVAGSFVVSALVIWRVWSAGT